MGIGITSNRSVRHTPHRTDFVSIPNGDRHYLELQEMIQVVQKAAVSIPNGDRHYLEPYPECGDRLKERFQSPMGIGITSNRRSKR